MTELRTDDTIKSIRETLAIAQSAIHYRAAAGRDRDRAERDAELLGRLIADCDRQRPLGLDGKHGDGERCTPTCGCELGHPGSPEGFMNWWTDGGPEALLQEAITYVDVTDLRGTIGNKIKRELLNGLWWLGKVRPLWSDTEWVEKNIPRHHFEVTWGDLAREVLARPALPIKDLLVTHTHTEEECGHRIGAHELPGVSTCSACGDHYANTEWCPQRCEVTYHEIITSVVKSERNGAFVDDDPRV